MTRAQAAKTLRDFNAWRRGNPSPMNAQNLNPRLIGEALERAIKALGGKVKP